MTRTEQQLRGALTALADLAEHPAPARVVRRRPVRVRATVLAVAAVLVLAVGASVMAVVRAGDDRTSAPIGGTSAPAPSTTAPSPSGSPSGSPSTLASFSPLQALFSLDPASGFTLAGRHTTESVQSGYVLLPDRSKAEIDVVLHAPGTFDPRDAMTGTRITVRGVPGWRGPVVDPETTLTLTSDVWQYAPDSWAQVTDRSGLAVGGASAAEELAVAEAVRVADPPAALSVPFRVGWLPDGLQVEVVDTSTSDTLPSASIGFGDDRAGTTPRLPASGSALTIGFTSAATTPTWPSNVDVDGHRGWVYDGPPSAARGQVQGRMLIVEYGDVYGAFAVDGLHTDRYDDATLVRIAAATRPVTPIVDLTAWIPAADAVLR